MPKRVSERDNPIHFKDVFVVVVGWDSCDFLLFE